jgi:glycosyltransferase involved in cell wall biosynthesis
LIRSARRDCRANFGLDDDDPAAVRQATWAPPSVEKPDRMPELSTRRHESTRPPIRLAVVADAVAPWSHGGREARYDELLGRLSDVGVDVTIYTMKWWDEPPTGDVRHIAIFPMIPLYRRGRRSIMHALAFALGSCRLLFATYDAILTDHIPYLHLVPLRLAALLRRRPLIVEWHEYWGADYWRDYLGMLGRVASVIESTSLRIPTAIVAVTPELRERLVARGDATKVHVVANGVSRQKLSQVTPANDAPQILCVGRLIDHKRVDVAIEAFAILAARDDSLRLGIVGDGPASAQLRQLTHDLGVADRCEFLGTYSDKEDVWALLCAASVLMFPSEREGFGLVVAEALALGTPVVCADHEGNEARRLVTDGCTGRILTTSAPVDYASATWSLLSSSTTRAEVTATFWDLHPTLDWDASSRDLLEILETAVGR